MQLHAEWQLTILESHKEGNDAYKPNISLGDGDITNVHVRQNHEFRTFSVSSASQALFRVPWIKVVAADAGASSALGTAQRALVMATPTPSPDRAV
mgnify:CR=1 FL=1